MAGKVRNLLFRNGRYSARLAVPKELREIIGKRELVEALGADRNEVLRRKDAVVARMRDTLNQARAQLANKGKSQRPPRPGQLLSVRQIAQAHYQSQIVFDEEIRNTDPRYSGVGIDDTYVADLRQAISGAASDDQLAATVGRIVAKYQAQGNTRAETGTSEWRELARALAVAEFEAVSRSVERDEGDFSGQPSHPLLVKEEPLPSDPLTARMLSPESAKPLSEIAEQFKGERGATALTNHSLDVTVRIFEEIVGEPKPLYRITRQDVHAFKRALSDAPANCTKLFPGMTLPQAIEANRKRVKPHPLLSPKTVNDKYLSKLHSVLAWCVRSDLIPDNPASSIKVETVKAKQAPRTEFKPSDLAAIFGKDNFAAPLNEDRWAMLISLFGGMRASELAQVRLDSVRTERGILVIAIEEETKTIGSQRIVPVHSTLLELGLERRVNELRKDGHTHLFPVWYRRAMETKARAKAGKGKSVLDHYFPRFIPKRFNETYLPSLGIEDSRKTWHSFRHTFKTGLALAGVGKDLRDELCGHKDYSAGAAYVHGTSVQRLKDAVELLQFDGLDLSHLPKTSP